MVSSSDKSMQNLAFVSVRSFKLFERAPLLDVKEKSVTFRFNLSVEDVKKNSKKIPTGFRYKTRDSIIFKSHFVINHNLLSRHFFFSNFTKTNEFKSTFQERTVGFVGDMAWTETDSRLFPR